jgi:hypothetical protein
MSHYRVIQAWDRKTSRKTWEEPSVPLGAQAIACPKCRARFVFCRSAEPFIDACGFESYTLECNECGASLAGIVDPDDETLLISEMPA